MSRSSTPTTSSNDGKFHWDQGRGILKLDGLAKATLPTADGGDTNEIQEAIDVVADKGGGVVFLRNGTYSVDSDIVIPSDVVLQGETAGGAIIDFTGAFQIICQGELVYSTGTISVNNKSATVTGAGTTWTTAMIGSYIQLNGAYYLIVDVASATSLTIEVPYEFGSIAGASYVIADTLTNILLKDFTVQNSTDANGAVLFQYCQDVSVDGVSVFDSTIGFKFENVWSASVTGVFVSGSGTGISITNCSTWTLGDFEVYAPTGVGILINKLLNASISNFTISTAGGNGMTVSNSSNWGLYDFAILSGAAIGIELASANNDILISGGNVSFSSSDGIKFTATTDKSSVMNCTLRSNGAYGINIAAVTCDNNTLSSNFFISNTSGTVNNAGTGTVSVNGN